MTTAAPRAPKFIDVITRLRNFALVTYAVDPKALQMLLPKEIEAEVFQVNSESKSFVSAAMFMNTGFHMPVLPWPRLDFGQTNYRAYVRHKGERAVWFFGTALHSPFVVVPKYAWQLPWHYTEIKITHDWTQQPRSCISFGYDAKGGWGAATVLMKGTGVPCGHLDGFVDETETTEVLTHPLTGFFPRSDGQIGTYGIWHDRLCMERCEVQYAQFAVFERLNLIEREQQPHSALIQWETDFVIYLPPRIADV